MASMKWVNSHGLRNGIYDVGKQSWPK